MEASNVASTPTTEDIGNAFVEKYYTAKPDELHKFYHDSSVVTRPQEDGTITTVTTTAEIRRNIQSLNYTDFSVEILSADFQPACNNGVMVVVTGFLAAAYNVKRKFAQSFFLAPQDKEFYVSNDVFRYVDDNLVDFEFVPTVVEFVPMEDELEDELEPTEAEFEAESGNLVNNIRSNLRKFLSFF